MKPQSSFAIPFAVCCLGVALFAVMDGTMKGLSLAIGVYNALFWRALAGSVLGVALMLGMRRRWPTGAVLRLHLMRGTVVAFMAILFFWGLVRLPMAEAIALSFVAPLIALYLAALLLGERVGRRAIGASLLGLAGVGVIVAGRMRGDYDAQALLGAGAILLSAMLFAWNLILQRQQAQRASPVEIACFQHFVMLALYALGAPALAVVPPTDAVPLLVGAALLAFASLAAFAWAYARAEAHRLIPVEYSAFPWSVIVGAVAFGEAVTLSTLAGAALIVAGCLVAARAGPKIRPPTNPPHVEVGAA